MILTLWTALTVLLTPTGFSSVSLYFIASCWELLYIFLLASCKTLFQSVSVFHTDGLSLTSMMVADFFKLSDLSTIRIAYLNLNQITAVVILMIECVQRG